LQAFVKIIFVAGQMVTTAMEVRKGKIKCEANLRRVCAKALLLFLFYRSDSQNGFADL
jgi:hypothetical protein